MPELPEIETIRRGLERELKGQCISAITVQDRRLLSKAAEAQWQDRLPGRSLQSFRRKGKYLDILLSDGWRIAFHMRMTGQLIIHNQSEQHLRLRITFHEGSQLDLVDQRRFAEVWLLSPTDPWPSRQPLGPDALEEATAAMFVAALRQKHSPVQSALLDQRLMAGVGNIYAQEALFQAGIRPTRKGYRISRQEAERLFAQVQKTLWRAIETGGSTSRNYRNAYGDSGSAQDWHAVYQKEGKPCQRCKGVLKAVRVGGRGTVYCPECQS
jgi:formamidopyrimidine-DNA glycosylase